MKLVLDDLTIGYASGRELKEIQKHISASIKPGEFTCLLGPNGAGKTTLLRTLSGLQPRLSGNFLIDGRPIDLIKSSELSKIIGIVLTERPSVSSMTVEQLVALGRSPYSGFWGRIADSDRKEVERAMAVTGVTSLRSRLVNSLSDGECQKVMIAKALAQQTPVLFLDEPTAFLDYPSKAELMILLRRLAKEKNMAIFQSTHDLNMALALADKIWLVDKKMGIITGTPRALAEAGELQRYFLRPGLTFNEATMTFSISLPNLKQ
ncbi:MAG: ABC transporter ATP-binding protein [Muribaculaceae bacterium]|nr:ABC transporter ATP-binding protein [Muribaculaceae bacterium]